MANPVIVEFILRGMPEIARAMKTVEDAAARADKNRERSASVSAKARTRAEEREAKEKVRAMLRADAEVKRIQDRATKMAERDARQRASADERAEREKVRAVEKSEGERVRLRQRADREIARMDKARSRENERLLREGLRLEEKTHREQTRMIQEREKARSRFARGVADKVTGIGGRALSTAAGAARGVFGTLSQLGGGFSIADSIQRQTELEKLSVNFSNSAYMGKGVRMDPSALQARARAASVATGTDANELMAGAHAFGAKTGAYQEGADSMQLFGEIAKGIGASIEDVSKAAGILRVQNEDLTPEAMKGLLLQTVRQGQKGSVEFSDLATSAGKITRTSSGYVGDQAKIQGELLGVAQLGMRTMSDPRDVATSLAGIESDTKRNWKKMNAAMGGDQFDEMGRIKKGPSEFIADVMETSGGDTRKLQDMGFNKQAMKYFQALAPEFQKAGGGRAGRDKILGTMNEITEGSMPYAELQTNLRRVLETSGEQFEASMRELRTAVGTELLPEFRALVPILRDMMPTVRQLLDGFVGLAGWVRTNPLQGLAALVGAAFAKELAVAGIGKLIEASLTSSLASKGLAIGGAVMTIAMAKMMIEQEFKGEADAQKAAVGHQIESVNLMSKLNRGEVLSPEEKTKSRDLLTEMRTDVQKQVDLREHPGVGKMASAAMTNALSGTVFGSLFGATPGAGKEAAQAEEQNRQKTISDLNTSISKLEQAIERNTTATSGNTGATKGDGAKTAPGARPASASTGIAQRN